MHFMHLSPRPLIAAVMFAALSAAAQIGAGPGPGAGIVSSPATASTAAVETLKARLGELSALVQSLSATTDQYNAKRAAAPKETDPARRNWEREVAALEAAAQAAIAAIERKQTEVAAAIATLKKAQASTAQLEKQGADADQAANAAKAAAKRALAR